jgi:hypothetical protein
MAGIEKACERFGLQMMDYQPRGEDGITYLSKGFLGAPYASDMLEKYNNHPEILAMLKMTTYEYAETKCGAKITMISELPIWLDQRLVDTSDAKESVGDIKAAKLAHTKRVLPEMRAAIAELKGRGASEQTPWLKNAIFGVRMIDKTLPDAEAETEKFANTRATKADLVDIEKLPIEEAIKLHQLYIKCLPEVAENQHLLDHHKNAFEAAVKKLEQISELRLLDLQTQIKIQAAMIFQGIEN